MVLHAWSKCAEYLEYTDNKFSFNLKLCIFIFVPFEQACELVL